jgi:hypothetical protein
MLRRRNRKWLECAGCSRNSAFWGGPPPKYQREPLQPDKRRQRHNDGHGKADNGREVFLFFGYPRTASIRFALSARR